MAANLWPTPETLARVSALELRAKELVEGFLMGLHRSPYRGASVEFADHREYVPGDDLRRLDWKVYAKSDRFTVKEYEEETNLTAHLLLDASESMDYGEGERNKWTAARTAAAALSYLLLRQQDAVGLTLFDEELRARLAPSSHPAHLKAVIEAMGRAEAARKTDLHRLFRGVAAEIRRRGVAVVLSDLWADAGAALKGLKALRARGEVIVFHVLHPDEIEFPFEGLTLFEGMEGAQDRLLEPRPLREAYRASAARALEEIRRGLSDARIDYVLLRTDEPLSKVLAAYLAFRERIRP